jgi:DNA-binding MarR family transcriptional regulator
MDCWGSLAGGVEHSLQGAVRNSHEHNRFPYDYRKARHSMVKKTKAATPRSDESQFGLQLPISRDNAPLNFLKLFYPFHYAVGMAVEKQLSGDTLNRHQTVILWIIKSKGQDGRTLPRKVIEQLIGEWYDLGSPAISKVLRKMAQPPLELIAIEESANSGREKSISLTEAGTETINAMIARTENFIAKISDRLTDAQILNGMDFMERVGEIVEFELESPDS